MVNAWPAISTTIGVIYTLAWSVSFYPQLILNYRRKAVTGFSMDFAHLNVLGFACYTLYTVAFLSSKTIQREYGLRNPGSEPLVRWNDALFAGHALLLSGLTVIQTYLPSYHKSQGQVVAKWARLFLLGSLVGIAGGLILAQLDKLAWIDVIYFMSYIKLVVSFLKYIPQLVLNYRRKSTVGWSILNISLDFTGGFLSLLRMQALPHKFEQLANMVELIIDCAVVDDFSAITGNIAKTGLGMLSLFFDILFIIQHFILYSGSDDIVEGSVAVTENDRLLAASNVRSDISQA